MPFSSGAFNPGQHPPLVKHVLSSSADERRDQSQSIRLPCPISVHRTTLQSKISDSITDRPRQVCSLIRRSFVGVVTYLWLRILIRKVVGIGSIVVQDSWGERAGCSDWPIVSQAGGGLGNTTHTKLRARRTESSSGSRLHKVGGESYIGGVATPLRLNIRYLCYAPFLPQSNLPPNYPSRQSSQSNNSCLTRNQDGSLFMLLPRWCLWQLRLFHLRGEFTFLSFITLNKALPVS